MTTERPSARGVVRDRGFDVPPGKVPVSGYVEVFRVRLACRDRMAVGDVAEAYNRLLQKLPNQEHPAPFGYWQDDGTFVVVDGRHAYIASVMLGLTHLLVTWLEEEKLA
jgi:hypothetical protein